MYIKVLWIFLQVVLIAIVTIICSTSYTEQCLLLRMTLLFHLSEDIVLSVYWTLLENDHPDIFLIGILPQCQTKAVFTEKHFAIYISKCINIIKSIDGEVSTSTKYSTPVLSTNCVPMLTSMPMSIQAHARVVLHRTQFARWIYAPRWLTGNYWASHMGILWW